MSGLPMETDPDLLAALYRPRDFSRRFGKFSDRYELLLMKPEPEFSVSKIEESWCVVFRGYEHSFVGAETKLVTVTWKTKCVTQEHAEEIMGKIRAIAQKKHDISDERDACYLEDDLIWTYLKEYYGKDMTFHYINGEISAEVGGLSFVIFDNIYGGNGYYVTAIVNRVNRKIKIAHSHQVDKIIREYTLPSFGDIAARVNVNKIDRIVNVYNMSCNVFRSFHVDLDDKTVMDYIHDYYSQIYDIAVTFDNYDLLFATYAQYQKATDAEITFEFHSRAKLVLMSSSPDNIERLQSYNPGPVERFIVWAEQ